MCQACAVNVDPSKQDEFAERFLGMLNGGMLMLLTSIGHRTGLFDAMGDGVPRSVKQLAGKTGLNERYVREWLGGMVAGRFVERNREADTYRLPAEHAHWLTRASPTANLGVLAQYLACLGGVEDRIVDCFKNGRGVPYSAFPRFHDVMAEDSGQSIVPIIVEEVVPMIAGMHERLERGIDVLDIGCGRGRAIARLAEAYPNSRFVGYDFSSEAVAWANDHARAKGLTNLRFVEKNLTEWSEPESFDWIMALDAIHDQARPDLVLAAVRKALRPGGVFLMQDIDANTEPVDNIDHPIGPTLYTISCMHCMTVSLAQGGMGLGTAWGVQLAERMLHDAGFDTVNINRFPHDIQNAYFVMRV